MIKIAVYHHDSDLRKKIVAALNETLKLCGIAYKLYSVHSFAKFASKYLQGAYEFDILCLEVTGTKLDSCVIEYKETGTELVFLDPTLERIEQYIRYKPVGLLQSDDLSEKKTGNVIRACMHYLGKSEARCFCIKTKTKSMRIPYREIVYMESHGHQVFLHTNQKQNFCSFTATLDAVEDILQMDIFVRCHQSYLVNFQYVWQLNRTDRKLILMSGREIDISKKYYKEISALFDSI